MPCDVHSIASECKPKTCII